jgi:hypothetical protein
MGGASTATSEAIKQIDANPNLTAEQKKEQKDAVEKLAQGGAAAAGGFFAILGGILGFCLLIGGLPTLLGGIGVLQRKQWGRILTLIFAFLMAIGGVLGILGSLHVPVLLVINLVAAVLGIWAIVVLFNSRYAAEFKRATA